MISIIMIHIPQPFDTLPLCAQKNIQVASGTVLFRQDDRTTGIYFVVSGQLDLIRHSRGGDDIIIHKAVAGQTFAEASLFSETYHCDARARLDSLVIQFERHAMLNAFASNPAFALELTKRFASQIQSYRRRMELLAIKSATERVYTAIADGMLTGTILDFSSEIGLTHEAVYRSLSKLVSQNRIQKTGRGAYLAK